MLSVLKSESQAVGRFVVLADFRAKVNNGQVEEHLLDGVVVLLRLLLKFLLRGRVLVVGVVVLLHFLLDFLRGLVLIVDPVSDGRGGS